eukprot:403359707
MYLSNRSKLRELEILKKKQADKIAVLEEEVEEKEEEKDAMLLKVEYFRNLVEQKDQEIQTLRSQYDLFRQDLMKQKEVLEGKVIDYEIENSKRTLPPVKNRNNNNLIIDHDFFDEKRDFNITSVKMQDNSNPFLQRSPNSQVAYQSQKGEFSNQTPKMNLTKHAKSEFTPSNFDSQYNSKSTNNSDDRKRGNAIKRPTQTTTTTSDNYFNNQSTIDHSSTQSTNNLGLSANKVLKNVIANNYSSSGKEKEDKNNSHGEINKNMTVTQQSTDMQFEMDSIIEEESKYEHSMIQPYTTNSLRLSTFKGYHTSYGLPTTPSKCILAHNNGGSCLAFARCGDLIATGGDCSVKIWDANTLTLKTSFSKLTKSVNCMAYSNNADYLLVCSNDYQAKILKSNPLRVMTFLNGHTDTINSCCFTNFSQRAVTGSADRMIKLWDIFRGSCTEKFVCASQCNSVDVSYSDRVYVSGHQDGSIRIWQLQAKTPAKEIIGLHDDAVTSAVFLPDGNHILTNSRDNTLKLIDSRTYEVVQTIEDALNYANPPFTPSRVAVNSVGNIAMVPSSSGHVVAFDLDSGGFIRTMKNDQLKGLADFDQQICSINGSVNTRIIDVGWAERQNRVATLDRSGYLTIWN